MYLYPSMWWFMFLNIHFFWTFIFSKHSCFLKTFIFVETQWIIFVLEPLLLPARFGASDQQTRRYRHQHGGRRRRGRGKQRRQQQQPKSGIFFHRQHDSARWQNLDHYGESMFCFFALFIDLLTDKVQPLSRAFPTTSATTFSTVWKPIAITSVKTPRRCCRGCWGCGKTWKYTTLTMNWVRGTLCRCLLGTQTRGKVLPRH